MAGTSQNQSNPNSGSSQQLADNAATLDESVGEIADIVELKGKRHRSEIWQHFSQISVIEKGKNIEKWKCNYCIKSYVKQKTGTTSQMTRHFKTNHYTMAEQREKKQKLFDPIAENIEETELISPLCVSSSYDHAKIKSIIAKMVIVHEYPFMLVEHLWFNILMKSMNPNYRKISRHAIKEECLKVYEVEKEKLKNNLKLIEHVSLTSDCWTSSQTVGYMCLTVHYISADWKLQSRIISFNDLDPPHSGHIISEAISEILLQWGLHNKVSTITLDNASSNDVAARNLKALFSRRSGPSGFIFMGEFFHVRCAAHILNLMVQDGLKEISHVIEKVRESILFIKRSPSRLHKFGEIARQVGLSTTRLLCTDVPTRWNSTYKMLESAFYYRAVFPEYALRDLNYTWLPFEQEWDQFDKVREVLSVFHSITDIFSGSSYPTANRLLPNLILIKKTLDRECSSDIAFIAQMATSMKVKFDKYWSDCSMLFSIACILDPRMKMFGINYYYPQIYNSEIVDEKIANVKQKLFDLYSYYAVQKNNGKDASEVSISQAGTSTSIGGPQGPQPQMGTGVVDVLADLYDFIDSTGSLVPQKSDLEIFLEEACVKCPDTEFDILEWWKMSALKYRILSRMAKDIFTVPITTVASESAFSAGGRVLGDYRSSLSPKSLDALVCSGSWIRSSYKSSKDPLHDILVEENLSVMVPDSMTVESTI